MVALQRHDVSHFCSDTGLAPTEPPTQDQARRLPKDQLPRRALVRVRTDVSVRSEEPSRTVSKSSVAPAPPLCYWDAGHNCGQMVLDACFCRCIWHHQVPLGGRRVRARVVVGEARARLASHVPSPFGVTCKCRSLQRTQE